MRRLRLVCIRNWSEDLFYVENKYASSLANVHLTVWNKLQRMHEDLSEQVTGAVSRLLLLEDAFSLVRMYRCFGFELAVALCKEVEGLIDQGPGVRK